MNTATVFAPVQYTWAELLRQEEAAFHQIPGMDKLRHAAPESIPELEEEYPDAAFALMIADNLFIGDREQNEIYQRAYAAILRGDSIADVRFRHDFDLDAYMKKHMWD